MPFRELTGRQKKKWRKKKNWKIPSDPRLSAGANKWQQPRCSTVSKNQKRSTSSRYSNSEVKVRIIKNRWSRDSLNHNTFSTTRLNAIWGLRFIGKSLKRKIALSGTSCHQRIWSLLGKSYGRNCVAWPTNLIYRTDKFKESTPTMISRLPLTSARRLWVIWATLRNFHSILICKTRWLHRVNPTCCLKCGSCF